MGASSQLYEILAVAGVATGVLALLLLAWFGFRLSRLRRAQVTILGAEDRDIVAHAEQLQREFVALRDWLEEATTQLAGRMAVAEGRIDGSLSHRALVRYDAFGELSGRQSSSIALLDDHHSGVVLTAIRSRNHSHLYVKQLTAGVSDVDLSPEEQRAVNEAINPNAPKAISGGGAIPPTAKAG